jgi:hypothetical protein
MNEGQGFDPGQPPVTPEGLIEPKKRGCLFWGCIISLILIVCIGGCITIGLYSVVRVAKNFTSEKPQPLPEYKPRPGEVEEVQKRIQKFREGAEDQPAELILTADDLNALASRSPDLKEIKGKGYIRIEGDKIYLDLSIPLEGVPFLSDRYLNATVHLEPAIVGGRPWLSIGEATANGQPIPQEFMEGLRQKNILSKLEDPKILDFARTAKTVEVKDGKIVLRK